MSYSFSVEITFYIQINVKSRRKIPMSEKQMCSKNNIIRHVENMINGRVYVNIHAKEVKLTNKCQGWTVRCVR